MRILLFLFLTLIGVTAKERIISFDSEIRVGRDGYLDVVETISFFVEGDEIRHGIYRDFPQEYKTVSGLKQIRPFEVTGVTLNGITEPYTVEKLGSGTRIRIGEAVVLLEKETVQTYTISYRTGRQLQFSEKSDELYWNVTGNYWVFPIEKATARVILPEGIKPLEAEAYTDSWGEKGTEYSQTEEADGVSFQTTATLDRREGLTVLVRWEPGKLDAAAYKGFGIWKGNEFFLMGLGVVGFGILTFLVLWFEVGRDPKRGVIVPRWTPPEGFSPAAVRYLKKMEFDDNCFTAAVLSLATKGAVKINKTESGLYELWYGFMKGELSPDEHELDNHLIEPGKMVLWLHNGNHKHIKQARDKLEAVLREKMRGELFGTHTRHWLTGFAVCLLGLFMMITTRDVWQVVVILTVIAALFVAGTVWWVERIARARFSRFLFVLIPLGFLPFVAFPLYALIGTAGFIYLAVVVTLIVVVPLFRYLIKAPTKEGQLVLDQIDGFREYLSVAEADRMNLENPPEQTPELFEKFLPYAYALGVEQKWAEQFEAVLAATKEQRKVKIYTPSFYSGGGGVGGALSIASIGASMGGALASSAVAPRTSGSGGGGGGFSGGGGGGGGGGGW